MQSHCQCQLIDLIFVIIEVKIMQEDLTMDLRIVVTLLVVLGTIFQVMEGLVSFH